MRDNNIIKRTLFYPVMINPVAMLSLSVLIALLVIIFSVGFLTSRKLYEQVSDKFLSVYEIIIVFVVNTWFWKRRLSELYVDYFMAVHFTEYVDLSDEQRADEIERVRIRYVNEYNRTRKIKIS